MTSPIDMQRAYSAFREYISSYDPTQPKIELKIAHILRVARRSRVLAIRLGWDEGAVELAELIGLLHDIGRFEQVARYDTFADSESCDHGLMGCEVLFGEDGIIRDFIEDPSFDEMILASISNHNKAAIEGADEMDARTLMHAKLIRDADKLDIYRVLIDEPNVALYGHEDVSGDVLTPAVYENLLQETLVDYRKRTPGSAPDNLLCAFAYVYDLYYDASYEMVLKDGNLERIGKAFFSDAETARLFVDANERVLAYCKAKVEGQD